MIMQLHRDMLVDEVMRRWPASIRLFLAWRMKCVGCPFGTFHTIADACIEHAANEAEFLQALQQAILEPAITPSAPPAERAGAGRG